MKKIKKFVKVLFYYSLYKIVSMLLKYKNRPVKILQYPDLRLTRTATYVDFEKMSYKKIERIFKKMYNSLMNQTYGEKLGIAAPQIGIDKRMMIVQGVPMINPIWKPTEAPLEQTYEGCYSLPKGEIYKTERAKYGWAIWYNMKGERMKYKIKGIQALVFQHELSHLDGICCNDIGKKIESVVGDSNNK